MNVVNLNHLTDATLDSIIQGAEDHCRAAAADLGATLTDVQIALVRAAAAKAMDLTVAALVELAEGVAERVRGVG